MKLRKVIVFSSAFVLALAAGIILFDKDNPGQASVDQEVYKVGRRILVMGAEGDTYMGGYTNPGIKKAAANKGDNKASAKTATETGVRTIALAFICVSEEPLFKGVLPAFQKHWEETTGEKVNFVTGYGQLGFDTLTTSVSGNPVQVSIDVSGNDPAKLGFEKGKKGNGKESVIFYYPLSFLVRKGNPKVIKTFEDLTKPGVQAIHADPIKSAGAGIWPVYAVYGSALKVSENLYGFKDYDAALEQLKIVEQNAILTDLAQTAGRDFSAGQGDVLLTNEGRALMIAGKNPNVEVVIPPNTILVEFSVFKMKKNIKKEDQVVVDAFIDFLLTPDAQEYFAQYGFRPVDSEVLAKHPEFLPVKDPFRLDYLGQPIKLKKELILDRWLKIKHFKKQEVSADQVKEILSDLEASEGSLNGTEYIGLD